jgi:DNA-directed RNA polymerase omega subunit
MTVTNKIPENQFSYVILVARRARQLMSGARPLIENPRAHKAARIAEEEVQLGLIEYEILAPPDPAAAETRRRG